jgi:Predicted xylanase/chitin deacetylase
MKRLKVSILVTLIIFTSGVFPPISALARTHSMDKHFFEESGDIVWNVKTTKKVIAITFDDGPHAVYTPQILDILKKYNAKATFFIVGENVEKNKKLLIRELDEGHELGNHTYTHPNTFTASVSKIKEEVIRTDRAIYNATGTHPKHFRSPGGAFDSELVSMSKQFNYDFILWTWWEDTKDWSRPGVTRIVNRVLSNPQNGDIVLFHDYVEGKSQTPHALEIVLPKLKEMGFEFVTVSRLLEIKDR